MTERIPSSGEALGDVQACLNRAYDALSTAYVAAPASEEIFATPTGYSDFRSAIAEALDRTHAAVGLVGS